MRDQFEEKRGFARLRKCNAGEPDYWNGFCTTPGSASGSFFNFDGKSACWSNRDEPSKNGAHAAESRAFDPRAAAICRIDGAGKLRHGTVAVAYEMNGNAHISDGHRLRKLSNPIYFSYRLDMQRQPQHRSVRLGDSSEKSIYTIDFYIFCK
ncbi:hypothetical protein [Paraburkholderia sp. HP33-1]|uniref:hypothetical protein n=1 Tax=Paraburkholderia sp. HP33-1 TaxID=2883243 RepID=UPI001F2FAA74|nr:hypothetical protein [Paraburkholderia sp. HP33-1]